MSYCPLCNGDCAGANPPQVDCPVDAFEEWWRERFIIRQKNEKQTALDAWLAAACMYGNWPTDQTVKVPQQWAVFCPECGGTWAVSYPHAGEEVCGFCAAAKPANTGSA